jgi:hypothetical protein
MTSGGKKIYICIYAYGPDRGERGDKQLDRYPLTPDKLFTSRFLTKAFHKPQLLPSKKISLRNITLPVLSLVLNE